MTWFVRRALRLAGEVRVLRDENTRLTVALAIQKHTVAVLSEQNQQLRRDADLLGLMAKDRKVALEFVRTAHDIDKQSEAS